MVVDFHVHCFAEKIASRALRQLAEVSGAREPRYDGTPAGLLDAMARCGVDRSVVLNIATNPRQQRAVNDFAVSLNGLSSPDGARRLLAFGSVHPAAPDALEELRRIRERGLRGVKFHPDYQDFFVDEPRMRPLYQEIARLGLITVFHAGVDIGLPGEVHCRPRALAAALPWFEGAPVVAAHFGGYLCWEEAERFLCGADVYLDSSYSASRLPPSWARRLLDRHDPARVLLGSDLPWADPRDEIYFLSSLGASPTETAALLGGNAARLLGIEEPREEN
ncbi:MAG: amidohydrolase family protein [Oscillospiraceae bacterium]|jgi:predicted TIM-barrel fold metal-dependent hydrolase|nr:amidohydrolase family protein [Oscillospiraceae bacterium]